MRASLGIFKLGGVLMSERLTPEENAICIIAALAGLVLNPETGEFEPTILSKNGRLSAVHEIFKKVDE